MWSAESSPTICWNTSASSARVVTRSASGRTFPSWAFPSTPRMPRRARRGERAHLLGLALPVPPVHAAVVEVIAREPPRLGEHLPPLDPRIERERPAGERKLRLVELVRSLAAGVEHVDRVGLADEQLLAVRGELVAVHVREPPRDAALPARAL